MVNLTLNGDALAVEPGSTVLGVVSAHLGRDNPIGVAVAVNKTVVPRSEWATRTLEDADEVELVGVMQGG
ncbi:MAG: sulfur carrier protein ThiS [Myxococcota bacterium]